MQRMQSLIDTGDNHALQLRKVVFFPLNAPVFVILENFNRLSLVFSYFKQFSNVRRADLPQLFRYFFFYSSFSTIYFCDNPPFLPAFA